MKYKYTKKDFKEYKSRVLYWLERFGISEYEVDFKQHLIDSAARTTYQVSSRLVCFQLTTSGESDFCLQNDLNRLALHEVIHLLLADFGYVINETKDVDCDLVIAAEHQVVMRMLRVFIDKG